MKNKVEKKMLFTFDYELFLGKNSGTLDKSLINPTKKLLKIFKKNNLQAIFFVDTTYILKLEELQHTHDIVKRDYDEILNQLVEMVKEGHLIYPHIHPHWLDAVYNEQTNTWDLSNDKKYRFANVNNIEQEKLFDYSISILQSILKKAGIDQKIDSYRAGGWSIQPFSTFKPWFLKYQLKYEFSVIPGKSFLSPAHEYDFYNAPNKQQYNFEDDINEEMPNGNFTAIIISVAELPKIINFLSSKLNVLLSHYLKLKFVNYVGDGKTVSYKNPISKDKFYTGKSRKVLSFESFDPIITFFQLKNIKKSQYHHFISHPKMLSKMNIFFTAFFLKRIAKKYQINSNFHLFNQP